jgi:hypothetical protein
MHALNFLGTTQSGGTVRPLSSSGHLHLTGNTTTIPLPACHACYSKRIFRHTGFNFGMIKNEMVVALKSSIWLLPSVLLKGLLPQNA